MKNEIVVDGVVFVKKDEIAQALNGLPYQIVRTYSAGVFAGYVESRNGKEVSILHARRLWKWAGAASLSQLANDGTKKPEDCMFPAPVNRIVVLEAIEILDCTETARVSISEVPEWKI